MHKIKNEKKYKCNQKDFILAGQEYLAIRNKLKAILKKTNKRKSK
jgi:hypothetical protein